MRAKRRRKGLAAAAVACAGAVVAAQSILTRWYLTQRARPSTDFAYEFLPNQTAQFQWLLMHPEKYRLMCRLTIEETHRAMRLMGFANPTLRFGRWKYCPLHRFMVFLMCMADSTRFWRLSTGTNLRTSVKPAADFVRLP